ncbi:MAG: pilus assembly protein TadG-related protein [Candidatus Binatus sp.]|uniref:pilus assembly protein TadG-related protein n=1 Tax=Candidatus Binatus sp. TaxID=2811406 RepID=UPI0027290370|nr:pilus assembly protein TadG-related protein [Candidatus Binatus sp.]MDO8432394.1 pilus assembly protein TadG-related protein [Candidatus Binatus sp.]
MPNHSRFTPINAHQSKRRSPTPPTASIAARREHGQTILMFAILLPILLGVLAFGVDLSVFYFTWSRMQSAADAAVLAAASALPADAAKAKTVATSYAVTNGALVSEIATPVVAADGLWVSITLTRQAPLYLARVLGLNTAPITVSAKAALQNTGSATGALPLGLSSQTTYALGQTIAIHKSNDVGPGNWDSLALGCTGASCLANNLANGYSGTLTVGQVVSSEPGGAVGPYNSAINARIAAGASSDPGGTWSSHTLDDQRLAIVPVMDWTGCEGRCPLTVQGFAAVWLVSPTSLIFIGSVVPGSTPSTTAAAYGSYRAVLVQ